MGEVEMGLEKETKEHMDKQLTLFKYKYKEKNITEVDGCVNERNV